MMRTSGFSAFSADPEGGDMGLKPEVIWEFIYLYFYPGGLLYVKLRLTPP